MRMSRHRLCGSTKCDHGAVTSTLRLQSVSKLVFCIENITTGLLFCKLVRDACSWDALSTQGAHKRRKHLSVCWLFW